ncbi:MAG: gamma-glutamyltransferase family protein, partial [Promethearchaeota archaeon]
MSENFKWDFPYPSQRMPILANNIVATSQPLAAQAGLRMLLKGGNAVDAAIATAITLSVVEPTMNGIGSDAFAILWDGKKLVGLNASGRSPAVWTPEYFSCYKKMPFLGWDAVTVPGAVSAWVELWKKYGSLEFKDLFEPAIRIARDGYLVPPITAKVWSTLTGQYKKFPEWIKTFTIRGKAPQSGQLFKCPDQADTLELIAETEGEAFYKGELAQKIIKYAENTGGAMTIDDLKNHKPEWVVPLEIEYKGVNLHEIPPNGQGITALIMLGILKNFDISSYHPDSIESLHLQIETMKLAFRDAHRYISDPSTLEFDPKYLLNPEYLNARSKLINLKKAVDFKHG